MLLWGHYTSLKCFDTTVSGVWCPCGVAGAPWGSSGTRSRCLERLLGGPDRAWHSLEQAWSLHGDPCSIAGGMCHAKMLLPQLWEAYFQDMCF